MGFVGGVLTDVKNRWETKRAQEAEAAKEARLAAIRAEERKQEFAQRKELTEYEMGERKALAAQEMAGRKELTEIEVGSREKMTNAELAARAADRAARERESAADRATRLATARIGAGGSEKDKPVKMESFVGEKSGRVVNLDMNRPADVQALREWQRKEGVRPAAAAGPADPVDLAAGPAGAPRAQSFALDFVKYPVTGKPPK